MMKKLIGTIACFSLAAILVVSCSSNENNQEAEVDATPTIDTVFIDGAQFHPDTISVVKGSTIVWINQDIVAHNVADYPAEEWVSDTLQSGDAWQKVIEHDFDYFCTIHPGMRGKVELK